MRVCVCFHVLGRKCLGEGERERVSVSCNCTYFSKHCKRVREADQRKVDTDKVRVIYSTLRKNTTAIDKRGRVTPN